MRAATVSRTPIAVSSGAKKRSPFHRQRLGLGNFHPIIRDHQTLGFNIGSGKEKVTLTIGSPYPDTPPCPDKVM